jgi:hypothetical protein
MATKGITFGAGGAERTAVYSRADNGYVRLQNPDGSFQPETYELKNGGNFGGPRTDVTMDLLSFQDVSRVISGPLATENFMPSQDPATTKLLIVVFWGTTVVPDDVMPYSNRPSRAQADRASLATQQIGGFGGKGSAPTIAAEFQLVQSSHDEAQALAEMEALMDAPINARNANILGYTDEIFRTAPRDPNMATLQDEIEHDRYYVVLLAYDYQSASKFGLHKLVWETRFSIPETGNDFEKEFPKMAAIASPFFGQNTHGLIHHNLANTHVEIGEPKSLGTLPEK